jgi:uncharacterized protein YyaL (SSP411 family)
MPLLLLLTLGLATTPLAPAQHAPVLRFSPRPNHAAQIHWRAFGPEAFDEARTTKRPVFLNLAAVWCHWCHVFDETTLSDPTVIAELNAHFISIRVDADQNPQVERRYLTGGWPTNLFLEENGEILGGGTYIPPERFLVLAHQVVAGFDTDRATLRQQLGTEARRTLTDLAPGALDPRLADRVGAQILADLDHVHGGFGGAPKFPQASALTLLAYLGQTRGDANALEAARMSLLHMGHGAIFDTVEGGFFRYAMQADWSSPHYEKMLAGNAELLHALCETYAATHDEALRGLATSIASYLVSHLWDEGAGGFFGSQDADEHYYALDAAGRANQPAPPVDHTFLADRMGLTARALIRASEVLGEPELARYAQRTEQLVLTRMRAPGGGVFHALSTQPGAHPTLAGAIDDQAQTALAQRELADPHGPGFFDVPPESHAAGLTAQPQKPLEENARLALALLRLGTVTGNEEPITLARTTLTAFAGNARGLQAAELARAIDAASGQRLRLVVVGPRTQPATLALRNACLAFTDPRRDVRSLYPTGKEAHLGSLTFPAGSPAVYACAGTVCSRPLRDASQLEPALRAFLRTHLP